MGFMTRLLRAGDRAQLKALAGLPPEIGALEAELEALSDEALRAKTDEFRSRLDRGEPIDDLLIEAFAVVREAARRVLGQRHYDVQLMGGAALHFGWIAEMATGEGKTLVSTLPAYLNGLTGKGVHVVTVNDYLARRDSELMGELHRWLGLTVGLVGSDAAVDPAARIAAYRCDITYGTNNEFGFDYLRDNMVGHPALRVQRGHHFAIIDEVDSILIDEARTPLIISGPTPGSVERYREFAAVVAALDPEEDFEAADEGTAVYPTPSGIAKVEASLGVENLYEGPSELVHHLNAALKARALFERDKDYLVRDGQVLIVDEFTGRVLDGRRWSDGIHQAVEAKEGVEVQPQTQTFATVTLQNYFRMYDRIAGMTGTALSDANELSTTYGLSVVQIPTHRPNRRVDHGDLVFRDEAPKFAAVVADIAERVERGQPVLAGTASVAKSEQLSALLTEAGIAHNVLNAKQHEREAEVIAQAGRPGAVTVATNMAGRGVDILLGGNPDALAAAELTAEGLTADSPEGAARLAELLEVHRERCAADAERVRAAGGLYVVGTERHESRRIDLQLRGRAGRQGDPGESRFYLSLADDMLANFATDHIAKLMGTSWDAEGPIESKMIDKMVERAQTAVEGRNAQSRKNVLDYDEVYDTQRKVIYSRRNDILDGADLRDTVLDAIAAEVEGIVAKHVDGAYPEDWDLDALAADLADSCKGSNVDDVRDALAGAGDLDGLNAAAVTFAQGHYLELTGVFDADLAALERGVLLTVIDREWLDHLRELDHLRDGIGLRAAGQKNPLDEWRREAFELFTALLDRITRTYGAAMLTLEVRDDEPADTSDGSGSGSGAG